MEWDGGTEVTVLPAETQRAGTARPIGRG